METIGSPVHFNLLTNTHTQTHLTQIAILEKQLEDRIRKNLRAEKELERKFSVCQEKASVLASVALLGTLKAA